MNKSAMLTIQGQGLSHRFGVFDWLLGILSVGWNMCLQLGSKIEGCLLYIICSKIYSIFARIECLQWYWRWSPVTTKQFTKHFIWKLWSYQNKQLYLNGKLTYFHNDKIGTNENNHLCLFSECRGTMECSALSYNPDLSTEWQMDQGRIVRNWLLIGLQSNQWWHTLFELRCSFKVF